MWRGKGSACTSLRAFYPPRPIGFAPADLDSIPPPRSPPGMYTLSSPSETEDPLGPHPISNAPGTFPAR